MIIVIPTAIYVTHASTLVGRNRYILLKKKEKRKRIKYLPYFIDCVTNVTNQNLKVTKNELSLTVILYVDMNDRRKRMLLLAGV